MLLPLVSTAAKSFGSIAVLVLLAGCAAPELSRSWKFQEHTVVWDATSKQSLKSWIGADVSGPEAVGGIFESRRKTEVLAFAKSLNRPSTFSSNATAIYPPQNPDAQLVVIHKAEGFVNIETKSGFETEALMLAMVQSKLFRYVWPVPVAGYGGSVAMFAADRKALFDNPDNPSGSQVLPKLEAFFIQYFTSRDRAAEVQIRSGQDEFEFSVQASRLRNFVVPGANYWETVEIHFVIGARLGLEKRGLLIVSSVSGRYASGLSSGPPPPKKFKSLEDSHPTELMRVEEELFAAFQRRFHATAKD